MKEWKTYKLRDICSMITDGSHFSPKGLPTGYPMLSVKDMGDYDFDYNDCKYISTEDYVSLVKAGCQPHKGDVLVAKDGNSALDHIFLCKETREEVILSSIAIFRPDIRIVLPEFLDYVLRAPSMHKYLKDNCISGSAIPRVVLKTFKDVPVCLPSLDSQLQIIKILKPIEQKIELNNRINHNLEEQAKALYKSWFVDFDPFKDGKFVESELGMIPNGWRVGTMDCLLEIKYGKDHKKLSDGLIPVYGSGGFMRYVNQSIYTGESVLIPRKGSLNNVMYVNEAFWTVDTMFYSVQKIQHTVKFCYHILSSLDLSMMNAGSAVPSMTTDILNSIKVIIPDEIALANFDLIMSSLYQRMLYNNNETQELVATRDSLLPKLMSGELSVNKIDC